MSQSDRDNFVPTDPTQFVTQTIDNAFRETGEALSQVPGEAVDFITKIPGFAVDAVEFTVDAINDTYQAGNQAYNQITNVIETPCEDKWNVLIETALPALGASMMMLLTPSPGEMLEEYLSPKNMRGAGRGPDGAKEVKRKRGRSGKIRRRWPRLPNVDSLIADRLPGAQRIQGRDVGNAQRWLFQGIDLADRVLWYFLLLDVTEEFFSVWSSGIMESRFCSSPLALAIVADIKPAETAFFQSYIDKASSYDIAAQEGRDQTQEDLLWFTRNFSGTLSAQYKVKTPGPVHTADFKTVTLNMWDEDNNFWQVDFEQSIPIGATELTIEVNHTFENVQRMQIATAFWYPQPFPDEFISGSVTVFGG